MNLAEELEQIQQLPSQVSPATKDQAMKEIIDGYVALHHDPNNNFSVPLLIRALNAETSLKREYERLNRNVSQFVMEEGNIHLVGTGIYGLDKSITIIDQAILKLYMTNV
ncbi:MAG: hypothetical protein AABW48_02040 [Nanoarchaeota archaeon]